MHDLLNHLNSEVCRFPSYASSGTVCQARASLTSQDSNSFWQESGYVRLGQVSARSILKSACVVGISFRLCLKYWDTRLG